MSLTNPSWNLSNADVTRLRNARDIVASIIPLWQVDGRYAASVGDLERMRFELDWLASTVESYIAVQGT